jgi:hypothetical protein
MLFAGTRPLNKRSNVPPIDRQSLLEWSVWAVRV